MLLLEKNDYKSHVKDSINDLNIILKEKYNFYIEIKIINTQLTLFKTSSSNDEIYSYNENENSIEYIDNYLKKYVSFFLINNTRKQYLLDIIKRIGDIQKSENIIIEAIKKGYIS